MCIHHVQLTEGLQMKFISVFSTYHGLFLSHAGRTTRQCPVQCQTLNHLLISFMSHHSLKSLNAPLWCLVLFTCRLFISIMPHLSSVSLRVGAEKREVLVDVVPGVCSAQAQLMKQTN